MNTRCLQLGTALAWLLCYCCLGMAGESAAKGSSLPENLARKAQVSATSEYSELYLAKFAIDGKVPAEGCKADAKEAWCVRRAKSGDKAEFHLEWSQPVDVVEIVYFGRTAQIISECWKEYEVYFDGKQKPVAKGTFHMVHGPQRIKVPKTKVRKITLKFLNSYGPHNPGASEIQVYALSPPDSLLDKFCPGAKTSAELAAKLKAGKLGFNKLLVIKRQGINSSHVYTYHVEGFRPGGGLYLFTPGRGDGGLKQLVASPGGQILDCDLSFDGKEILFSWKQGGRSLAAQYDRSIPPDTNPDHKYKVFRINVDGSGLRELTDGTSNNFNACWLPDGSIAFLSDRKPAFAYCFVTTSPVLYRMDRDGSNVRRLSSNYLNDFTPSVLPDGRIIYSRWEYVDRPACPIQSLWTINPDGTGLSVFFGNRVLAPGTFMEARSIPNTTKVLCLITNHNGACRGAIGIIDPARGVNSRASIRNLTPEVDIYRVRGVMGNGLNGPYENPYPVDEDYFLVSRGGTVLLRDYDGTEQTVLLHPRDGMGFYCPQPLSARRKPPAIASNLPAAEQAGQWATVCLQDVYVGLEPDVQRGEIKQICVVQEVEKSKWAPQTLSSHRSTNIAAFGFQFPLVSCGATYAPKKVWGYASVAEDGSACFKVPAGVPIYFMAIDAQGRAVQRMRSFTHFMPGEVQSCVGCHVSRSNQTGRTRTSSTLFARPPQELEPPEWGLEGFSYSRVVQPVFDRYCLKCHNAGNAQQGVDLSGDKTDFFNVSYEILARKGTIGEVHFEHHNVPLSSGKEGRSPYTSWISTINGSEYNILMTSPRTWGSPASKLAELILSGHPDADGKPRVNMDMISQRRVMVWIDLNVPYYSTSASNYLDRMGCRRIYPAQLNAVLQQVAKTRCVSCHTKGIPRQFYTRITNPHLNSFLLAPLAESAGGTGKCGTVVFQSTRDADYQAILATFKPIEKMLKRNPRMDMLPVPGKLP